MIARLIIAAALWFSLGGLASAQYGGPLPFRLGNASSFGAPQSLGSTALSVGAVSTAALTTTANIVQGDLVAVCVNMNTNNSVTAASVSDGTNTYIKAGTTGLYSASEASLWYKDNATAVGSGASITVTLSGGASGTTNGFAIGAARISGAIVSPLDKTAINSTTGAGASISTTTSALSQASEVAFSCGGMIAASGTYSSNTGGFGFTNINHAENLTSDTFEALDSVTVSSTAALTSTQTWTVSGARSGIVVGTFK